MTKRTLVMDIELYPNYLLVCFKSVDNRIVRSFGAWIEPHEDPTLYHPNIDWNTIVAVMRQYQIVTFNGIDFDMPLVFYAMRGATFAELRAARDHIINAELRHWQFEQEYGVRTPEWVDAVDLREPVPGVKISLKLYGGRLHSKRLQDLPFPPDQSLTAEQRDHVLAYCENDLDTTIDLWNKARDPKDDIIGTRELLTAEFGIDVRSKSDAQIAEAIIRSQVEKRMGDRVYRAEVRPGTTFNYRPPAWMRFESPALQAKLIEICQSPFVVNDKGKIDMPPALRAKKSGKRQAGDGDDANNLEEVIAAPQSSMVTIGRTAYSMGIGGLHSTEKRQGARATGGVLLRDRDVVSYYPSLILQCGLFPENMGEHFQVVFKQFFDRRVHAKKAGHKSTAQTLKIFLNGCFGKLGSKFSVLYAPNLLIQVTVTGQLALLMLIERMEAAGIPVISGNTDGIVMACPAHLESRMQEIVQWWERTTGLETEETKYRALFSRDVNNYAALKEGGGVKTKGVLADPGVMKNPDHTITTKAVCDFLDKGVPIAETILRCRDVREFVTVKRVSGGGHWGDKYLGKVVRWVRSTKSSTPITYGPGKKHGHKVGGSDNARPVMDLPDSLPDDIDYDFYLGEARDLLREIGAMQ